ncbi:uncharacterized protein RSE6_06055 [Rhynchosporium secalis]|uniref:Uncharacterized protein n=1 Tax=Rhynchosporium secalis TaxID=38038 RepID=A0A1E1M9E7_RHYSE|nr:uncharacterized protein RSE6_06055 [Rhynchosporium secalis]
MDILFGVLSVVGFIVGGWGCYDDDNCDVQQNYKEMFGAWGLELVVVKFEGEMVVNENLKVCCRGVLREGIQEGVPLSSSVYVLLFYEGEKLAGDGIFLIRMDVSTSK